MSYQIGDKRRVKSSDILHFKYFTQDGLTGLPPLYALRDELKIQQAGNRTLHNFFTRGVSGSGILKVHKSDLDGSAKNAIRESLKKPTVQVVEIMLLERSFLMKQWTTNIRNKHRCFEAYQFQ